MWWERRTATRGAEGWYDGAVGGPLTCPLRLGICHFVEVLPQLASPRLAVVARGQHSVQPPRDPLLGEKFLHVEHVVPWGGWGVGEVWSVGCERRGGVERLRGGEGEGWHVTSHEERRNDVTAATAVVE